LLEFEAGIELRVGRNKGGAVEAILQEAVRGAPVAYLGDDLTDEAAFRAINNFRTHSLSVLMRRQRHETEADVWLRPPVELRDAYQTFIRWVIEPRTVEQSPLHKKEADQKTGRPQNTPEDLSLGLSNAIQITCD